MKIVHASELEDLSNSINSLGFKYDDFEILERENPALTSGAFAISGEVEINRKSIGLRKNYAAGHGSSWPAQFHQDLQAGAFGRA